MTTPFARKKQRILAELDKPAAEYTDASPKGSVDDSVRALVDAINSVDTLVTTSSCAGRIAVFAQGAKTDTEPAKKTVSERDSKELSNPQGKGTGKWLFVSHNPVSIDDDSGSTWKGLSSLLSNSQNEIATREDAIIVEDLHSAIPPAAGLLHFKFEPLILHIMCADTSAARKVLIAAQGAGFRESGISSLPDMPATIQLPNGSPAALEDDGTRKYPRRVRKPQRGPGEGPVMVAIRTTGLSMDAPIGYSDTSGKITMSVGGRLLASLIHISNERFAMNQDRKLRLCNAIMKAFVVDDGALESGGIS